MATQLFATTDGSFTVEIDDRGGKHWTPTLGGIRVDAAMPLDHARCVVLLDFHHEGRHLRDALRCIDADGLIVWLAQPVSSSDEYVSVRLNVAWPTTPAPVVAEPVAKKRRGRSVESES